MNNPQIPAAVANAMLNAGIGTPAAGGILCIYSGTQPAAGGGALSGNTMLVQFNLPNPAFPGAVGGVLTANNIPTAVAAATGTAAWFRLFQSDGVTPLLDGSVGTTGCDVNLATTTITQNDTIALTSLTITQPLT